MSADPSKDIKLRSKILKRGRPKGAEVTVIGMPKKKKVKRQNGMFQPFCKMRAEEKDCILLECFVKPSVAQNAIRGNY